MGGGGQSTTTTQGIPEELKPLASRYAAQAMKLSDTPYQPYTGNRVADLNQTQNQGISAITDRAIGGSATMNNAESNLNDMMNGGTNPYLDSMVSSAMNQVGGKVNSQFSGSNYGTTANQETLSRSLGDTASNMYGNAYNTNQSNRLQAIGMAPTFGNQAYTDASQLLNAGQLQQDQSQKGLDIGCQNYQDAQNDPYKKLAAEAGIFSTNLGAASNTTSSGGGK
jgi:hypothetical protein